MKQCNGRQPHDLDSLKLIMDCRVKPGKDARGGGTRRVNDADEQPAQPNAPL
jgi:hypothetical protein